MPRAWSGRQQETLGQQIHVGPATHLALEHLETVEVPFERALTPGQGDSCLARGVILTQAFGQAPEGRQGARGGARQPWIELSRLALADGGPARSPDAA